MPGLLHLRGGEPVHGGPAAAPAARGPLVCASAWAGARRQRLARAPCATPRTLSHGGRCLVAGLLAFVGRPVQEGDRPRLPNRHCEISALAFGVVVPAPRDVHVQPGVRVQPGTRGPRPPLALLGDAWHPLAMEGGLHILRDLLPPEQHAIARRRLQGSPIETVMPLLTIVDELAEVACASPQNGGLEGASCNFLRCLAHKPLGDLLLVLRFGRGATLTHRSAHALGHGKGLGRHLGLEPAMRCELALLSVGRSGLQLLPLLEEDVRPLEHAVVRRHREVVREILLHRHRQWVLLFVSVEKRERRDRGHLRLPVRPHGPHGR
mmetsp:Transcript_20824/g.60152  ORF Transcript_20824/g.60152 Transcript_20824/m.60152 type:complete len:322 (-) Transcript_20824:508-1473(-)